MEKGEGGGGENELLIQNVEKRAGGVCFVDIGKGEGEEGHHSGDWKNCMGRVALPIYWHRGSQKEKREVFLTMSKPQGKKYREGLRLQGQQTNA